MPTYRYTGLKPHVLSAGVVTRGGHDGHFPHQTLVQPGDIVELTPQQRAGMEDRFVLMPDAPPPPAPAAPRRGR
jgi:hypothetical protein